MIENFVQKKFERKIQRKNRLSHTATSSFLSERERTPELFNRTFNRLSSSLDKKFQNLIKISPRKKFNKDQKIETNLERYKKAQNSIGKISQITPKQS
jgi:hypothetical protein